MSKLNVIICLVLSVSICTNATEDIFEPSTGVDAQYCELYAGIHRVWDKKVGMYIVDMNITIDGYKSFELKKVKTSAIFTTIERTSTSNIDKVGDAIQISWSTKDDYFKTLALKSVFIGEVCGKEQKTGIFFYGVNDDGVEQTPMELEQFREYKFTTREPIVVTTPSSDAHKWYPSVVMVIISFVLLAF